MAKRKVPVYHMTEVGYRRITRRRIKAKVKCPSRKIQDQTCPWCGEKFTPGQSIVEYDELVYHNDCFEIWGTAHLYDITDTKPRMLQPKDMGSGDKIEIQL